MLTEGEQGRSWRGAACYLEAQRVNWGAEPEASLCAHGRHDVQSLMGGFPCVLSRASLCAIYDGFLCVLLRAFGEQPSYLGEQRAN